MSIDLPWADRINEFCPFYMVEIAERSDIHNSSFDNHHSSFEKVSYKIPRSAAAACIQVSKQI